MKCRLCSLTHPARTFQTVSAAIRMSSIAILLLILFHGVRAAATDRQGQSAARPCAFSDAAFDTATNVHALDEYYNAISQLLKEEQFVELDCLADAARAGKTRFSGGAWKLRQFYVALDSPRPGHPSRKIGAIISTLSTAGNTRILVPSPPRLSSPSPTSAMPGTHAETAIPTA
jgi:hypothetical protein